MIKKIPDSKGPFRVEEDLLYQNLEKQEKPIPVWLDCDTGVDDAIALLLLDRLSSFELVGVSTVAGNVGLDKTTRNTLAVMDLMGSDVPVYRGAPLPLFRDQITAPEVHGKDGLGGAVLPPPKREVETLPAWDGLYQAAKAYGGDLVLIAVGPMTNLGLALTKYKDLAGLIKRVVIMGGAAKGGNTSPAAEFNILVDPEAADILFDSGVSVEMCGLDMTMKAYLIGEEIDDLAALSTPQAAFAGECLQYYLGFYRSFGHPGVALHDPAAVLYAADPSIFQAYPAWIRVETKGGPSYGKTVTDLYSDKKMEDRRHKVVTDLDREAFKARLFYLMGLYGQE